MKNPMNKNLKINVRLFRRVQRAILRWPENFNMNSDIGHIGETFKPMEFHPQTMKKPSCGSACCVFGWAVTFAEKSSLAELRRRNGSLDIKKIGAEVLGLTQWQATKIYEWKGKHFSLQQVTAQEAADMIERFLQDPTAEKL